MNPPYTDLQLQLFLAKELPELIRLQARGSFNRGVIDEFYWLEGYKVTPREWDWVVKEVEKKLSITTQWDLRASFNDPNPSWQQRTITLAKTLGKQIE